MAFDGKTLTFEMYSFNRRLASTLGSTNKAVIVEFIAWSCRHKQSIDSGGYKEFYFDGHWWMKDTFDAWHERFDWLSKNTLKRYFKSLKDDGWIIQKKPRSRFADHTCYYRVDNTKLSSMIVSFVDYRDTKMVPTIENPKRSRVGAKMGSTPTQNGTSSSDKSLLSLLNKNICQSMESTDPRQSDNTHINSLFPDSKDDSNKSIPTQKPKKQPPLESKPKTKSYYTQGFLDAWNGYCGTLPKAQKLSEKRKRQIRSLLKENEDLTYWETVIKRLASSDFCTGKNDRGWTANIDFLLRPDTHLKIMEGQYDNKKPFSKQEKSWGERNDDFIRDELGGCLSNLF
jgi:hypothetical protein